VDADRITRTMVEDYRDTLRRQEYGDSTIRKFVGALGTMYRWAKGRSLLAENPVEGVKRPP
jgi:site-specific recombinase XerD